MCESLKKSVLEVIIPYSLIDENEMMNKVELFRYFCTYLSESNFQILAID